MKYRMSNTIDSHLAYMEHYHDDLANCMQEIIVVSCIQHDIITVVFSCLSGIEDWKYDSISSTCNIFYALKKNKLLQKSTCLKNRKVELTAYFYNIHSHCSKSLAGHFWGSSKYKYAGDESQYLAGSYNTSMCIYNYWVFYKYYNTVMKYDEIQLQCLPEVRRRVLLFFPDDVFVV